MQALAISIKGNLRQPVNAKGIPLLLKQTESDVICHFCGRIKRRANRSVLINSTNRAAPESLGIQLLPLNVYYHKALVRCGYNPRLEIFMRPSKLLAEIIEHLNNKWNPARIENSNQEFTVSLMAPWEGKFIEYNKNQEKITIGDVHMSLESPASWHLYYYWKPVGNHVPEPINNHSEHSLLSTSIFNLIEDQSNSMPFFNSQMIEDSKPMTLNSPFKMLFTKGPHDPFSKADVPITVPNLMCSSHEIAHDISLTEFKPEGDESMFTSWFHRH